MRIDILENWDIVQVVRDWSRNNVGATEEFARAMHDAVTNTVSGILPWLKIQW